MFNSYDCLYDVIFRNNYKEHTEDLFYLYCYFNTFNFDIGTRSDGKVVNDIVFEH